MSQHVTHIGWPTAPGNGATITMVDTSTLWSGIKQNVRRQRITAIEIVWLLNDQASAANGVRGYAYDAAGTAREIDFKSDSNVATIGSAAAVQVPVLSTGQEWRETFVVTPYLDVKIEYTAGPTGPTATTGWGGMIVLHHGALSVVR